MTIMHTAIPFAAPLPPSPPYDEKEPQPPPIPHVLGPLTPARTPHTSGTGLERHIRHRTQSSEGRTERRGPGHAEQVVEAQHEEHGRVQLEDFELIRVLGKGCAGRVLLVRNARRNTVHAMKAISKRSVLSARELPHTLTELSILKQFAIHEPDNDFVTRLNCSFTDRENFYFVMDFYPGGDLATQLEIYGKLGQGRTRFYAADLVVGLEDLHRNGVILRDLKPENILLDRKGHCVIADFGLSKQFAYRGEPQAIHVPRFSGDRRFPTWAGKGMGSVRTGVSGMERIVIDRASSFVGTTDYLAPEVILAQEYTYAIDWWGLGCILFECLFGRAPFRAHNSDDCQVLYNKILYNHWADSINPRDDKLDVVTDHFLDALLQKEPLRRLTEPGVRNHHYFANVDWATVRSREYEDPHPLNLHPIDEYNTRYFPRLCLEQEPSVDMSTHKAEDEDEGDEFAEVPQDPRNLTALNDENTYIFQQYKYKKELEGFYWDRWEHERELEQDVDELHQVPELDETGEVENGNGTHAEDLDVGPNVERWHHRPSPSTSTVSVDSDLDVDLQAISHSPDDDEVSIAPTEVDEIPSDPPVIQVDEKAVEVVIEVSLGRDHALKTAEAEARLATPVLTPVMLSGTMSTMQLGSPAAVPEKMVTPDTSTKEIAVVVQDGEDIHRAPAVLTITPASPSPKPAAAAGPTMEEQGAAVLPGLSPLLSRPSTSTGRPIPTVAQSLQRPDGTHPRLPSGLPASGLSVSDIVSIPSPGIEGPRLIRRHAPMPSIDSIPVPRLSVDVHGTITQLGEDDWEAVDIDGDIPSVPNGYGSGAPPSSFLTRLRRRPSTIIASGLRHHSQRSSDSSRDSSPTKGGGGIRPVFSTPKKALEKLKALPGIRSRHTSEESSSTSTDNPASPPEARTQPPSPVFLNVRGRFSPERFRPRAPSRRNTASEWVERKFSRGKSIVEQGGGSRSSQRSLTQSSDASTWGTASEGKLVGPPRVELRASEPVIWDFEGRKEKGASE